MKSADTDNRLYIVTTNQRSFRRKHISFSGFENRLLKKKPRRDHDKDFQTNSNTRENTEKQSSWALAINVDVDMARLLGPILFLFYINDLPKSIHRSFVNTYADDTTDLYVYPQNARWPEIDI